jgi:amino acid transporter
MAKTKPPQPPSLSDVMHKLDEILSILKKSERKAESRYKLTPWANLVGLGIGIIVAGLVAGNQENPGGIQWLPIPVTWWFVLLLAGVTLMIAGGIGIFVMVRKEKIS